MSIPQIMTENGEIYQLLFQFIKLSEILGKIIQGIYSPLAQQRSYEYGSYDLVTSLDNELTEWRFSFSKTLRQSKYDDFNEDNGYFSPVIGNIIYIKREKRKRSLIYYFFFIKHQCNFFILVHLYYYIDHLSN